MRRNGLEVRILAPVDGEVVAVAAGTGKLRWTRRIGASETSPLLFGRLVIVGDWLGNVHCLWAETGKTLWTFKTGGAGGICPPRPAFRRELFQLCFRCFTRTLGI